MNYEEMIIILITVEQYIVYVYSGVVLNLSRTYSTGEHRLIFSGSGAWIYTHR